MFDVQFVYSVDYFIWVAKVSISFGVIVYLIWWVPHITKGLIKKYLPNGEEKAAKIDAFLASYKKSMEAGAGLVEKVYINPLVRLAKAVKNLLGSKKKTDNESD